MGTNRRKYIRFSPKENVCAAFGKVNYKLGMINEISLAGLSFEVTIDEESEIELFPKVDIFLENDEFNLPDIACRMIYKKNILTVHKNSEQKWTSKATRYGLKFSGLTEEQKDKMAFFVLSYA